MYQISKTIIAVLLSIFIIISSYYSFSSRRNGYTKSRSTEELNYQLREVCNSLERQLNDRVKECERLEQSITTAGLGIDECLELTRQLRFDIRQFGDSSQSEIANARVIVSELRIRINEYENRINKLEEVCQSIKRSLEEQ